VWLAATLRRYAPALRERLPWLLVVTAVVASRYVLRDTHGGGGNLINLALALMAVLLAERGRQTSAGLLLGFSLATKPTHVLLVPLLWWFGQRRTAALSVIGAAAFTGVSLLLLVWPVMAVTAFIVWLEDGGPVLYRQVRVGRDNRPFEILKFRSMSVDAERDGARWATAGDARVTRIGRFIRKTRIDELPQLINVIRGDMSFVGPRPEQPRIFQELREQVSGYHERQRVLPGITGWAQVRYSYGSSTQETSQKLQYDLYYVKNHSLLLDLLIALQTVEVILWTKGAR